MVFVESEVDPFVALAQQEIWDATLQDPGARGIAVRRPLRGIEVKEPTYSYMRVIDSSGQPLLFRNSSAPGRDGYAIADHYANYLIQALTFANAEKFQIVPSFGETYAFFFGEQPVQAQLNGGLLNTLDFPWSEEMWINYRELIRGTRLAERGARLYLYYDGVLLEGYPTAYQPNQTADVPNLVPFGMSLLVTSIEMLAPVSTAFPSRRQQIDLSDPSVYQQLLSMDEADRKAWFDQYAGSQINQLNKARYLAARKGPSFAGTLGVLLEAQSTGRAVSSIVEGGAVEAVGSAGFLADMAASWVPRGIECLDWFMKHDSAGGAMRAAGPAGWMRDRIAPLRSRIFDNVDEYVVRPSDQSAASPAPGPPQLQGNPFESGGVRPAPPGSETERERLRGPHIVRSPIADAWNMGDDEPRPPVMSDLDARYQPDAGTMFGSTPGEPPPFGSTATDGELVDSVA